MERLFKCVLTAGMEVLEIIEGRAWGSYIFHYEVKQRLICDGVRAVVVCEFGMGDIISPRPWIVSTKDLKISFHLLVYSIGLSVRLRVIGGGKGEVIF